MNDFTIRRAQWRNQIADDRRVSPAGFLLAYILSTYFSAEGEAWPSQKTLAARTGIGERHVRDLLKDLKAKGYLAIEKHGRNKVDRYRIPEAWTPDRPELQARSPDEPTGPTVPTDRVHSSNRPELQARSRPELQARLTLSSRTPSKEPLLKNPSDDDSISFENKKEPPDFEGFWNAYPKKVGKVQAEREYEKALKLNVVSPAALVIGAKRYAEKRRGEDEKFTKRPGNWLRDQGWTEVELRPDPDPEDARKLLQLERLLEQCNAIADSVRWNHDLAVEDVEFVEKASIIDYAETLLSRLRETVHADRARAADEKWRSLPALAENAKQTRERQLIYAQEVREFRQRNAAERARAPLRGPLRPSAKDDQRI